MSKALKAFGTVAPTQTERANERQVKNSAGGFVYKVTDKARLERFLILGTDGGTYYANQKSLTTKNANFVIDLAARDPKLLIDTVVEVSTEGRAAKASPAIFALAIAINSVPAEYKGAVREAVIKVCRTSTQLFEFAQYVENLGGWGRAKKGAVAGWYQSKTPDQIAYQAVKYRQRDGWTHRDLLRLSHPVLGPEFVPAVDFILGRESENAPRIVDGFRKAQEAKDVKTLIGIVTEYNLPWEAVPTQFLRDETLWKAFVENRTIGHTAIIRNVSRMQEIGAFKDMKFAALVAKILSDPAEIAKGGLHPVQFLNARGMYAKGATNAKVLGALEDGFYASFKNAEPSNARTLLALDVSGSMTWAGPAGLKGMDAMEASAAMAMVTLRNEPYVDVKAFAHTLQDVNLSATDNIETVLRKMNSLSFGRTDCSLPMVYAKKAGIAVDHFVVYTDNETYAGTVHPDKALRDYRQASGINAKLTVVGMTATDFTIADPQDAGMMDVVGFDAAAPKIMTDFARV